MNVAMLPMWVLSGVFFSSQRFPEAVQPFIKALPLTALIDSLRANMLEGAGLADRLDLVPGLGQSRHGVRMNVLQQQGTVQRVQRQHLFPTK